LDILRADGKQLARTTNRDLIKPFVDLNFGPQEHYPQAQLLVADPEDIEALTKGIAQLMPFGLRVKQTEIREKLGLSDPSDDDELLAAPAPSAPPEPAGTSADEAESSPAKADPAKEEPEEKPTTRPAQVQDQRQAALAAIVSDHKRSCGCAACTALLSAEAGQPDAMAEVDALFAGAMDDWQAVADPLLAPLASIIREAGSLEEALTMLETRLPNAAKLAERLGPLTAIARGIGDLAD
jgi:phage gp29-like protein